MSPAAARSEPRGAPRQCQARTCARTEDREGGVMDSGGGGRQLTGDVLLRLFRSPAPPARRLAVNRAPLRPCPQPQSWTQHLVPTRWSPFRLQGQGQQPLLWTGPLQALRENEPLPPQPRWPRRGPRQMLQRRQACPRPQAGPAAEPSQHDRSISQGVISSGRLLDSPAGPDGGKAVRCTPTTV